MCGITGMVAKGPVNQLIYDALIMLQHRGQDAAGMVTCENDRFNLRKENGLVRDVFHVRHMRRLTGNMGIGHVRYPTAGSSSAAEAQPFYVNSPYGIALAHNGNLTNADELAREMFEKALRHINTTSDSEVLLNIFAYELQRLGLLEPRAEDVFEAVSEVLKRCKGGYAAVAMITGHGVVAFRDPWGIRPLCYGKKSTAAGVEYMVASESVALDALGFELVGDVAPGEAIYITQDGQFFREQCVKPQGFWPCIFEYVYLARPDSIIDGVSVYESRLNMGRYLAHKILRTFPDHDIDVVIPIPDTSRTSAVEVADVLGVPLREGFVKNRYIGRTFIMPGQAVRKKSVRQKLNPIRFEFRGRNVLLMDDSIVRGTTMREIVQMARDSGARKVYVCSAAPPVRWPNVYGIDMAAANELVAHERTEDQVGDLVGADRMFYQDVDDLVASVMDENPALNAFDLSIFDGRYITGDVDSQYLLALSDRRCDAARRQAEQPDADAESNAIIDLYNNH
jgi:amidophosphoribosyltransferase